MRQSAPGSFSWLFFLICFGAVPCGLAQNTSGIFVTPVANAPFTGVIVEERTTVSQNSGSGVNLKTIRDVARDNQGRVYNLFRELVPALDSATPLAVTIHIYDAQSRSDTFLYPQQKIYMTRTVEDPPAAEPADLVASPRGNSLPLNQFTRQEDLGTQSIEGVSAHGVREIQTIPAASSNTGNEIVLTDEYWYSDELQMNVVVKHSDPRSGDVTMTLTQVTRADPDPSLFQIPNGYKSRGVGSGTQDFHQAANQTPGAPQQLSPRTYHVGGLVSAPRLVLAP